jgi:hypothetical protein
MAGTKEDAVTDAVWSGKMSAPDHNNQFPCALLRTGFRFAFTQSAVLKGALFRKQRGQESQARLTFSFLLGLDKRLRGWLTGFFAKCL